MNLIQFTSTLLNPQPLYQPSKADIVLLTHTIFAIYNLYISSQHVKILTLAYLLNQTLTLSQMLTPA